MPSPFPGMDPYLEHPILWGTLHQRMITYVGDELNRLLPPGYTASTEERIYLVQPNRKIVPDVALLQSDRPSQSSRTSTATATAAVADPPWLASFVPEEVTEAFINILALGPENRVVTTIELLSPSNKTKGHEGRDLYQAKQREVLARSTHLLEIDLLLHGAHTVIVPPDQLARHAPWNYVIDLSRAGARQHCQVWTITLRQPLPRILVPLAEPDADIVLELQPLLDYFYDRARMAQRLDYRCDPPMRLSTSDAEWADELLRANGLRP